MEQLELIQKTLIWLKENPNHWITERESDGQGNYCAVGAMRMINNDDLYTYKALILIHKSTIKLFGRYSLSSVNDYLGYDAVIQTLEKTIADNQPVKKPAEEIVAA